MSSKRCEATTKPATAWIVEIHQHLLTHHAELLWIRRHCEGVDDALVKLITQALGPMEQAAGRLALPEKPDDGKGTDVSTGPVDVPYPHDGGSDGGRASQWSGPALASGSAA